MFKLAFSDSDSRVTQRVTRARRRLLPSSFNCAFTSTGLSMEIGYKKELLTVGRDTPYNAFYEMVKEGTET